MADSERPQKNFECTVNGVPFAETVHPFLTLKEAILVGQGFVCVSPWVFLCWVKENEECEE